MVAERSSQDCFTQSAGLLYAVRRIALRSPQDCFTQSARLPSAVEVTLHFNFLDLHFLPDPSTGSGILFGLRDPTTQRSLHAVLNSFDFIFRNVCRRIALRSPCNPCDTPLGAFAIEATYRKFLERE